MSPSSRLDIPALIALDWGTSSLRAYALGAHGRVLDQRRSEHGIMNLPEVDGTGTRAARFEQALQSICGDWLQAYPGVPLLACGMVGSAQGWKEALYQPLPSQPADLARAITVVQRAGQQALHIVPGLIQAGDLPNVMRGEETQIAGVLQGLAAEAVVHERLLIGLPGTHSKWALVEAGAVTRFHTFMTGEIYAALRQHTILGRTMASQPLFDDAAFSQGLRVARSPDGALGVLSNVFSCRTLALTGRLAATAQPDYLSGLLIGHEVAALARTALNGGLPVLLCGEPELCRRYAAALEVHGLDTPQIRSEATPLGLWCIARAAALA
ncbi:2-dehydro-3-deoxygalactonokinase [Hydrogenophaga sp.]|uniref:2-dehydro-3-deoxygalactonokinase n=1 Tax=Hydrogenophaga sp. TaxID=1904254 RepID=UPI0035620377